MRAAALAILLATLLLPAAAGAGIGSRVSGPGFDGIVIDLPSPRPDAEVWVPGYDAIAEMEKALPAYVKRYIKTHGIVLTRPLSKYKRHYVGILEKGRRLIGASYYSDAADFVTSKAWLTRVGDAGPCDRMGTVYDVDAKAFVLFEVENRGGDARR